MAYSKEVPPDSEIGKLHELDHVETEFMVVGRYMGDGMWAVFSEQIADAEHHVEVAYFPKEVIGWWPLRAELVRGPVAKFSEIAVLIAEVGDLLKRKLPGLSDKFAAPIAGEIAELFGFGVLPMEGPTPAEIADLARRLDEQTAKLEELAAEVEAHTRLINELDRRATGAK